ncbi:hypothetical protein ACHAXR_004329 [Thalassiosira sp. AJA248-18]
MGSELEQPLLTSGSSTSMTEPRILDRDGTFSQSRGRWSVSSTNARSQAFGSARQRRAGAATTNANAATLSSGGPHGVAPSPRRPPNSPPPLCCCRGNDQPRLGRRCWDDWFHSLSYTPTCILMLGVFVAYFITIVIFAGLYLTVNKVGMHYAESDTNGGGGGNDMSLGSGTGDVDIPSFCGMDINNHMEALYFSLSTMATIGYGTSDYYFGECWTPFILVLLQVFSAIVFSSLAIGLLFQRMSRGQKRGRTIVFSDVAVVRKVRGRWYWMFRVAELRKRHIIGAKIRVFCVRHERCPVAMVGEGGDVENGGGNAVELETAHFVSHPLPLLNGSQSATNSSPPSLADTNEEEPNSESSFEQSILMGLPHVVVHRMDSLSPMMPPRPVWYDEGGVPHSYTSSLSPSTNLSTSTESTAEENIEENAATSSLLPTGTGVGQSTPSSSLSQPPSTGNLANQPTQEEITHFLQDRQAEIIVFLEGTCEVTGMSLQARHSYRMEDIAFNQTFAPCVFTARLNSSTASRKKLWDPFAKSKAKVDQDSKPQGSGSEGVYTYQGNAALEIDFSQFHDLLPANYDSMSCPYIPSSSLRKR